MIHFVVMGVSGCGKSTVGQALASQTGRVYVEGDTLHDAANVAKMSRGEALTDTDRWPWLSRIGKQLQSADEPLIVGCSALRKVYRDRIRSGAQGPVAFIHLAAEQSLIAQRLEQRAGHFMSPTLLTSQFETLEPLQADECGLAIDISRSVEQVIADAANFMRQQAND